MIHKRLRISPAAFDDPIGRKVIFLKILKKSKYHGILFKKIWNIDDFNKYQILSRKLREI